MKKVFLIISVSMALLYSVYGSMVFSRFLAIPIKNETLITEATDVWTFDVCDSDTSLLNKLFPSDTVYILFPVKDIKPVTCNGKVFTTPHNIKGQSNFFITSIEESYTGYWISFMLKSKNTEAPMNVWRYQFAYNKLKWRIIKKNFQKS